MREIIVHTETIEKDDTGQSAIMFHGTPNLYFQKGDRFAHLLRLPSVAPLNRKTDTRTSGFGNTNVTAALSTVIQEPSRHWHLWKIPACLSRFSISVCLGTCFHSTELYY